MSRGQQHDALDDGPPTHETVAFAVDGAAYEIDLHPDGAEALRAALAPYVAAARRVARRPRASRGRAAPTAAEIRAWARAHGYDVPDRGRLPVDVRRAFDAWH